MGNVMILRRINANMKAGIKSVLNGDKKKFDSRFITPEMVCSHLELLGWEKGEMTNNGWQWDWWIPFTKGEQSFTAFGSGYYGSFSFFKTEE